MDEAFWLIVTLALAVGLVVIHELGHALAAFLLTGEGTLVMIGSPADRHAEVRLGKLKLRLFPNLLGGGWCRVPDSASPRDHFFISIAGPAASLAAAVLLWWITLTFVQPGTGWVVFGLAGVASLIHFLNSIDPREYKEGFSDGHIALEVWRRFRRTPFWRTPMNDDTDVEDESSFANRLLRASFDAAWNGNAPWVGTEHLLVALADWEGDCGRILRGAGLSSERIREALPSYPAGRPPEGPRSTPAMDRVLSAAASHLSLRGDEEIDAEHVFLALLAERDGLAREVIEGLGARPDQLRTSMVQAMAAS